MAMKLSWSSETPKVIKNIRDTLLSFLAGCLAFAPLFAPKLNITGEDYAMWIGFIMLAIGSIAKMFGVSEAEAVENVMKAVEEVKEVSENKKS